MGCARAIAALSQAVRLKVGAIMVSGSDGHGIIAEGYNGTPSGFDNGCEYTRRQGHAVLHIGNGRQRCVQCNKYWQEKADYTEFCPGMDELVTKPEVLHAESNAIAKVAKSTNSSQGATLYVTCSPCFECSKIIIQAGIKRVVYETEYRITDGIDLLRKANIEVEKL